MKEPDTSTVSAMSVLLVLLYTVCLLLLTMYLQFRWQYRHVLAIATKLPCPPTLPIIGNALLFFGDITDVTKNLLKISSDSKGIFCFWIGPLPIFVVVDPSDIQVILNTSSMLEKDNLYSLLKKYRRLMNPVMHPSNVENFFPVFNEVGRKLTEQLSVSSPPSGRTDEIFEMAVTASTTRHLMLKMFMYNGFAVGLNKCVPLSVYAISTTFISSVPECEVYKTSGLYQTIEVEEGAPFLCRGG
ncbi:hypothetical protein J6590_076155 [Homalodisca vitripennis]|nr:hypothetical protein J6590_076155 [Homalodisca vitripennis]